MSNWRRQVDLTSYPDCNTASTKDTIFISEFGDLAISRLKFKSKQLNQDEILQIISKYQNGYNARQLAKEYECHRDTISKHLKKHGISVTKSKIHSEAESAKLVALYKSGLTMNEIAINQV